MRIVYAVSSGSYSDYRVHAIFDRLEDAEATVAQLKDDCGDPLEIEPMPFREPGDQVPKRVMVYYALRRDYDWKLHEWSRPEIGWNCGDKAAFEADGADFYFSAEGPDPERVRKSVNDRYFKMLAEKVERGEDISAFPDIAGITDPPESS